MDEREGLSSWLQGGPSGGDAAAGDAGRGRRLGLPADGPGSLARLGRRAVALAIDWAASTAVSAALFGADPMATLGVFAVENVVLLGTLGHTLGHRLVGLRVRRLRMTPGATAAAAPAVAADDGRAPGVLSAAVRTVLLCLVVPAVVWDADGRGLHDRLAGTAIVRR